MDAGILAEAVSRAMARVSPPREGGSTPSEDTTGTAETTYDPTDGNPTPAPASETPVNGADAPVRADDMQIQDGSSLEDDAAVSVATILSNDASSAPAEPANDPSTEPSTEPSTDEEVLAAILPAPTPVAGDPDPEVPLTEMPTSQPAESPEPATEPAIAGSGTPEPGTAVLPETTFASANEIPQDVVPTATEPDFGPATSFVETVEVVQETIETPLPEAVPVEAAYSEEPAAPVLPENTFAATDAPETVSSTIVTEEVLPEAPAAVLPETATAPVQPEDEPVMTTTVLEDRPEADEAPVVFAAPVDPAVTSQAFVSASVEEESAEPTASSATTDRPVVESRHRPNETPEKPVKASALPIAVPGASAPADGSKEETEAAAGSRPAVKKVPAKSTPAEPAYVPMAVADSKETSKSLGHLDLPMEMIDAMKDEAGPGTGDASAQDGRNGTTPGSPSWMPLMTPAAVMAADPSRVQEAVRAASVPVVEPAGSDPAAGPGASASSTAGTSTPSAPAEAAQRPDPAAYMEKIVRAARLAQSREQTRIKILLNPPRLGSLRVDLAVRDHVLTGTLRTENVEAKQLIQNHLDTLRETLEKQGIHVGSFTVTVDQGDPGARQRSESGRGSRTRSHGSRAEGIGSGGVPELAERRRASLRQQVLDVLA